MYEDFVPSFAPAVTHRRHHLWANPDTCFARSTTHCANFHAFHFAGGEVDVRGCYTALALASMLQLDAVSLATTASAATFIKRCQVRSALFFLSALLANMHLLACLLVSLSALPG